MTTTSRPKLIVTAILLVASTLIVYGAGLSGGFIFDDFPNLVFDPDWKATSFSGREFRTALINGIASPMGRPLAVASFAFNHALTGMDPFWLKLTGVIIHAGNGLLVWALCKRILAHLWPHGARAHPGAWTSLLVAAAWLLHPLQVSSVLYVVQRMELGASTGTLLALLAYLRGRESQLVGKAGWPWFVLAGLATLLGLGFKETALLAPAFAFLIELCVFRFRQANGRLSQMWLAAYGLAFTTAIVVFATLAIPLSGETAYAIREFNRTERILTQLPVLALYLKLILVPSPEQMLFYYDNFTVSRTLNEPATAAAGILLATMGAFAVTTLKRWPLVSFGILWFFVAHALTSNILPLELVFEHRNYLAIVGVLLALVTPLHSVISRLNPPARALTASLPVLTLAILCWIQASTWGNPLQLAWTLENRNPSSTRAVYGLGRELMLSSGQDPESPAWSIARSQFMLAADLSKTSALPLQGVLLMDGQQGRTISTDLWEKFRNRITSGGVGIEDINALHAVSECQIQRKCWFDHGQLLTTFLAALEANPGSPEIRVMYANYAWNVLRDEDLAIALQRETVRLFPTNPTFILGLAKFLLESQNPMNVSEGREIIELLQMQGHVLEIGSRPTGPPPP